MKKNILEYKGYHTNIEFDTEACVLRGKIEGINDLVNFESSDPQKIEEEFHCAVDDYLEFCAEVGKEPDKEYKGSFNIRIRPELHKKLAVIASKNGESLNSTIEKALEEYTNEEKVETSIKLQQTIKILMERLETERICDREYPEKVRSESEIISHVGYLNPKIKMRYQEKRAN